MDNLLHFMWIMYSIIVTSLGVSVLYVKSIPYICTRLFTFGKANMSINGKHCLAELLEVPKRWFSHFYVFAAVYLIYITLEVCYKYFCYGSSSFLVYLLDFFGSTARRGKIHPESIVILSFLMSFHVCRRCYECFCVSVYSDAKMNIIHYTVGFTFYFGVGLSLIHDAPGFESHDDNIDERLYFSDQWFILRHIVGTVLFLWAFVLQFKTHNSLGSLRKTGSKVVSKQHYKPSGGFFEYVSCPHYFAEIVMYLSGCLILGGKSYSWWLVCLFTTANQIMAGLMNHHWYLQKFEDYPKNRKAVIPFIL